MDLSGSVLSGSDSNTDAYSSAEESENENGHTAARRDAAERDFDAMEDDPDDLDAMEFSPEEELRVWLAEKGEDGELVFDGTVKALLSSGVKPDMWIAELEGMERDGVLPGFFAAEEERARAEAARAAWKATRRRQSIEGALDADQGDDLEADEEELDASPEQQRAFRMSVLMRDDDVSDSDGSGDDDDVENGHANGSPKAGGVVSNPLAKAAGKNRNQRHMQIALEPKQLGETTSRKSSMVKRRRGGIASGTAGFHSDVDRCQRAIKRISGLLECEISDSIVTLGILLLVLIYEGQQMKKGDDSKFGESLKFRCTYALEQHTRPLKQGWLKKQGEMGEAFKQRWFALFPDIWTYGQDSTKYGRIMAFYRSEPRSLEERCSPKGAIMLSQDQYTITLVGDQMSLELGSDVDGFIDAGEMRYNYVFAAPDFADERMSSSTPKSILQSSERLPQMTGMEEIQDWAQILSDHSRPPREELELMMPENIQSRVITETCRELECDRASIFLLDDRTDELVLSIGKGADAKEIRIPKAAGIAGECLMKEQVLLINAPYNDQRFNQATDKKTGYTTTSILAVPIKTADGTCIGVLQAINKLPEASDVGFDEVDEALASRLACTEQLANRSLSKAKAHADLEGKTWRQRSKAGFSAGKLEMFNVSTTKKFIFFSCIVTLLQVFAAVKLSLNAERFDPDEVASFILEGFLEVMNCTDTEEDFEGRTIYTSCAVLVGDGKQVGTTFHGVNRITRGQMANSFADLAEERRLEDVNEGTFVAPLDWPWSDNEDRLWEFLPVDDGPPNVICFTSKGVTNAIVNIMSASLIVGYFIVGEVYNMGRGFFMFVGGPLASLIAPVPHGHIIFYSMNGLAGLIVLILIYASWIRIFTVAQDFWMCVETSVSVFVVLELDDRVLPMLREDVKRKCRRSLLKRGLTITDEEAARETQRAMGTSITAGKEYALHGLCMAYFTVVLLFGAYYSTLFACGCQTVPRGQKTDAAADLGRWHRGVDGEWADNDCS